LDSWTQILIFRLKFPDMIQIKLYWSRYFEFCKFEKLDSFFLRYLACFMTKSVKDSALHNNRLWYFWDRNCEFFVPILSKLCWMEKWVILDFLNLILRNWSFWYVNIGWNYYWFFYTLWIRLIYPKKRLLIVLKISSNFAFARLEEAKSETTKWMN